MPKYPGRAVRWSLSTDGGSSYTPFAGSTSDSIEFAFEGINVTDKDDAAWVTMLDAVGVRSASGTVELFIEDTTILALVLDSPTTWLHDLKLEIDGLFEVTGEFFINTTGVSGAEGAEGATMTMGVQSSGALSFSAS